MILFYAFVGFNQGEPNRRFLAFQVALIRCTSLLTRLMDRGVVL